MGGVLSNTGTRDAGKAAAHETSVGMISASANVSDGIVHATKNIQMGMKQTAASLDDAAVHVAKDVQQAAEHVGDDLKDAAKHVGDDIKQAADHVADDVEASAKEIGKDIDVATAILAGTVSAAVASCTNTIFFLAAFHVSAAVVIISMWLWIPGGDPATLLKFSVCWTLIFSLTWQVMTRVQGINAMWWPIFATVAGGWALWMAAVSATMLFALLYKEDAPVVIAIIVVIIVVIIIAFVASKLSCCSKICGTVFAEKALLEQDLEKDLGEIQAGLQPLLSKGEAGQVS